LDVQLIGSKASVGVFENGIRDIGIDRGLVFSTGQVTSLSQANDGSDAQASSITPDDFLGEDPDLQRLTDSSIEEVSGLKMTVIPRENRIEFRYVFGSEEYPEFNCAVNNDVLGIFITGPNPTRVEPHLLIFQFGQIVSIVVLQEQGLQKYVMGQASHSVFLNITMIILVVKI